MCRDSNSPSSAAAKRFDYIEKLLEHQKTLPQSCSEGFVIRIITLYGKAGDKFQEAYLFMIDCENNKVGKPDAVLDELAKEVGADAVYAHREVSHEEEKIEGVMEKESISHITNIIINLPSTVAAYVRERYSTNPTTTLTPLL
ncbi:unnamed protein product [Vicia faba]|uniref:Uncharacterized protein n=1 Tax=Vicia faba TaxID=3906 RepID=A0AAV1AYU5_VICFA|nr:unnamed protein product [Vicia faba]CAI8615707.1 unnamed protein product [Vicia faba]